jgi:hypothetical protein
MDGIEIINPYEGATKQNMKKILLEKAQEFLAGSKLDRKRRRELARASAKHLMNKLESNHANV